MVLHEKDLAHCWEFWRRILGPRAEEEAALESGKDTNLSRGSRKVPSRPTPGPQPSESTSELSKDKWAPLQPTKQEVKSVCIPGEHEHS